MITAKFRDASVTESCSQDLIPLIKFQVKFVHCLKLSFLVGCFRSCDNVCPIESWHLPVSTFVHEVCDELRCGSLPVIHRVPIGLNNVNNPSIETKNTF